MFLLLFKEPFNELEGIRPKSLQFNSAASVIYVAPISSLGIPGGCEKQFVPAKLAESLQKVGLSRFAAVRGTHDVSRFALSRPAGKSIRKRHLLASRLI